MHMLLVSWVFTVEIRLSQARPRVVDNMGNVLSNFGDMELLRNCKFRILTIRILVSFSGRPRVFIEPRRPKTNQPSNSISRVGIYQGAGACIVSASRGSSRRFGRRCAFAFARHCHLTLPPPLVEAHVLISLVPQSLLPPQAADGAGHPGTQAEARCRSHRGRGLHRRRLQFHRCVFPGGGKGPHEDNWWLTSSNLGHSGGGD